MLDLNLASKIIDELGKYAPKKLALTNTSGEVISKSKGFGLSEKFLDTASIKSFPIGLDRSSIGYIYIDESPEFIKDEAQALVAIADLVIHQNYYTEELLNDQNRLDQLLFDFFKSKYVDLFEIRKQLDCFGTDVLVNKTAIILEIDDPEYLFFDKPEVLAGERENKISRTKKQISGTVASFYRDHQNNYVTYLGNTRFLILKDMGNRPQDYESDFQKTLSSLHYSLSNEIRSKITLGVGEYKKNDLGIRESYREADTALRLGKQLWGVGHVYHYDAFGVVAPLFSGITEQNINLPKEIIKKLNASPRLMETLETYFDMDISLTRTAKKLGLHRNTLVYRLEKIGEITGYDPRIFNEAFQLKMALVMESYGTT